jgi:GxxExxY protein
MKKELFDRGIYFETQKSVPVQYKGELMEADLRYDLFVENILVVELKAIDGVLPVHQAQILTYMKLLKSPLGLMINFNVSHLYNEGQKTYVNELYRNLPE